MFFNFSFDLLLLEIQSNLLAVEKKFHLISLESCGIFVNVGTQVE